MKDKKLTGSFYTPKIIADFLVGCISLKLKNFNKISILEPSAGNGVFIDAIYRNIELQQKIKSIVAVEIDKTELDKISYNNFNKTFKGIHADFLDFQKIKNKKYTVVIGNPPYIKKKLLNENQVTICKEIHKKFNLSKTQPNNIWTAFLVSCIELTAKNGILALVLPSELLQVKFAAELRELILMKFERVEIFTFNELLFKDCKGQDTLLLIGEKKSNQKGIYYSCINKLSDLKESEYTLNQNVTIRESKWTHYHLETEEIELLEKLKQKIQKTNNYCNSKAGIVTAANDYFIVNTGIVNEFSLQKFVKPIIQKGVLVNGSVTFTKEEFQMLVEKSVPTYLLDLNQNTSLLDNTNLMNYLQIGQEREINKRYKTLMRKKWYEVPNIGIAPDAFFFKRCNEYPKIIKNDAKVLATDSAYIITMKDDFKIENLIYSFYNSLTLSFAELQGRYYGGGVLELTPNEFKNLPIPYMSLRNGEFLQFTEDFKNKNSIKDILRKNDALILKSIDNAIDDYTINKIAKIREKLFNRRIKSNSC